MAYNESCCLEGNNPSNADRAGPITAGYALNNAIAIKTYILLIYYNYYVSIPQVIDHFNKQKKCNLTYVIIMSALFFSLLFKLSNILCLISIPNQKYPNVPNNILNTAF